MSQKMLSRKLCRIKAFTLLESLLVLFLVSLLTLTLSGSVHQTFSDIQTKLFFLNFEHLYQDSQQLSISQQTPVRLSLNGRQVSNGFQRLPLPDEVSLVTERDIEFSTTGGNSSLTKLVFQTRDSQVTYQLYIGSGRYKKTVTSLYSP